tara:strand:- start:174 stop:353 length:180 start_codon:yes stop_codon:yes gene_type:complete
LLIFKLNDYICIIATFNYIITENKNIILKYYLFLETNKVSMPIAIGTDLSKMSPGVFGR